MAKAQRRAVFLTSILLVGLGFFLYEVSSVLMPFVVGLVLAYMINPLVDKLENTGMPRPLAATIPVVVAVSVITVGLVAGVPLLIEQLTSFARRLPVYLMMLEHFVLPERVSALMNVQFSLDAVLEELGVLGARGAELTVQALQSTVSGAMWLFNLLLLVVMTPLVAFYLLMDWPQIMQKTLDQLPKSWRSDVRQVSREIDDKLAAYLRGMLVVAVAMSAFYCLLLVGMAPVASWLSGTSVAQLELAWAIGIVTGFLVFIPVIGAALGFILMIAVALVQYQLQLWEPYALLLVIFFLGQALESYVMTPNLVGNRIGLHPLWVMFALLAGGALAGIVGMLAAVPVAVVVSILLPRLMGLWRQAVT